MTLMVSWVGVDSRGTASAYIAADSRVSWKLQARPQGPVFQKNFDFGRKVYGLANHPDLIGYCGDVLFPSVVLGQIAEMADGGLLFTANATSEGKRDAIGQKLRQQFHEYPPEVVDAVDTPLQFLHISRDTSNPPAFHAYLIEWHRRTGWKQTALPCPAQSGLLCVLGTGGPEFSARFDQYKRGPTSETSRAVFQCFCTTLASIQDARSGGAPQLVGLYRKPESASVKYGIIFHGQRYLFGARVDDLSNFNAIEWRNEEFELCDGESKRRRPDAQPQPDPLKF